MTQRTPEFDKLMFDYMPALNKYAARLEPLDPEDLVQEALICIMRRWESYRPDGCFSQWARLIMGSLAADRRKSAKPPAERITDDSVRLSTPASQENTVYARQVVQSLSDSRGGQMLLRMANGDVGREVGARFGCSFQRVDQLTKEARATLHKRGFSAAA